MTPHRLELHIVRPDTLCHVLGAFADTHLSMTIDKPRCNGLPEWLWRRLEQIASLPRAPDGELQRLGGIAHVSPASLRVHLHKIRHHGYRPRYRDALP